LGLQSCEAALGGATAPRSLANQDAAV
jgi:hypothetical protein